MDVPLFYKWTIFQDRHIPRNALMDIDWSKERRTLDDGLQEAFASEN